MDDEENNLFNIAVSSSDDETSTPKVPRDFQSEEDFQRQRAEWRAPIETGQIWKSLQLPVDRPLKQEMQKILHAIEELYFLRDYERAAEVADNVLKGELAVEFKEAVEGYRQKCLGKLEKSKSS